MSRHEISGRLPHHTIAIGWDPPLETYYAIVYDTSRPSPESETGKIILWVGTVWRELPELDKLVRMIAPYVALRRDLRHTLYLDRQAADDRG